MATLNIRGVNALTKRQEIEDWMTRRRIDCLCLPETKVPHSSREKRTHEWRFASTTTTSQEPHGVGLVFSQFYQKYVNNVTAVSLRIIYAHIKAQMLFYIFSAYAPHAGTTTEQKQ